MDTMPTDRAIASAVLTIYSQWGEPSSPPTRDEPWPDITITDEVYDELREQMPPDHFLRAEILDVARGLIAEENSEMIVDCARQWGEPEDPDDL